MLDWIMQHRVSIMWMVGGTIVFAIAAMIIVPIVVVRLPADYLQKNAAQQGKGGAGWRVARNILGWLLMAVGIAMLALPGPGVAVLLIGVLLADFPGKQRVVRWMLSRGGVLRSMNRLRARFGRPPLRTDESSGEGGAKAEGSGAPG